jgi:hypothetical protein
LKFKRYYLEYTYKVHNKTVNLKLYPEVAPLYRAAIQPHRKLKSLLGRLECLRPVTFGRIAVAGALLIAAFHQALQYRALAEVVQLKEFLS